MKLILALFSLSLAAEVVRVKDFSVNNQINWEAKQNMFSLPLLFFSERVNGQASNISFSGTGLDGDLDYTRMKNDEGGYKKIKENFLSKVNGELIALIPYEKKTSTLGHTLHSQGMAFRLNGKTYQEKSYFIECGKKHFYAKTLRLRENKAHDEKFNSLLDQFDCEAP